jgi:hypothetical protein
MCCLEIHIREEVTLTTCQAQFILWTARRHHEIEIAYNWFFVGCPMPEIYSFFVLIYSFLTQKKLDQIKLTYPKPTSKLSTNKIF